MKMLSILMAGVVLSALLVFSPSTAVLAYEEEHSQSDIQMLRDAASALKATNPDLSEKLTKYADREAEEGTEEEEENETK